MSPLDRLLAEVRADDFRLKLAFEGRSNLLLKLDRLARIVETYDTVMNTTYPSVTAYHRALQCAQSESNLIAAGEKE